jgi:hypothetical protein
MNTTTPLPPCQKCGKPNDNRRQFCTACMNQRFARDPFRSDSLDGRPPLNDWLDLGHGGFRRRAHRGPQ